MQQDYKAASKTSVDLAQWARKISREWRILFGTSNITELTPETFADCIFGSEDVEDNVEDSENSTNSTAVSWFVLFTDGIECGPCRTAKTNLMRLGSSAVGLGLRVAFVNCQKYRTFCTEEQDAPKPPHSPFVKAWSRSRLERQTHPEGVVL